MGGGGTLATRFADVQFYSTSSSYLSYMYLTDRQTDRQTDSAYRPHML